MVPCHIPEYRSPEYERAFDELWALACHGRVTVVQVRQEMSRLHQQLVMTPARTAVQQPPDGMGMPHQSEANALDPVLSAPAL